MKKAPLHATFVKGVLIKKQPDPTQSVHSSWRSDDLQSSNHIIWILNTSILVYFDTILIDREEMTMTSGDLQGGI